MEKPIVRISVRNLVEFILRNGDLVSGSSASDKEAMLKGSRLHRKIQKQMGSHYQPEVSLKKDTEYDDLILRVEGRADGIFSQDDRFCIDEIKGVYVPFWLFDADVNADARYKATKIRVWSDKDYDYTETNYYSVFRSGNMSFASVPVDGSTKMADDLMESIEPFRIEEAVDFQTAYLAGYLADKYDVDARESTDRAQERMKISAQEVLRNTVKGYATVTQENTSLQVYGGEAKYALYPVWILNTTWKGKKYLFAMNGQTGKMTGDLPIDNGAYAKWLAGLTILCSAAAYLAVMLIY